MNTQEASERLQRAEAYWKACEATGMAHECRARTLVIRSYLDGLNDAGVPEIPSKSPLSDYIESIKKEAATAEQEIIRRYETRLAELVAKLAAIEATVRPNRSLGDFDDTATIARVFAEAYALRISVEKAHRYMDESGIIGSRDTTHQGLTLRVRSIIARHNEQKALAENYHRSVAAFDLIAHLRRQIEFSARTFGPASRVDGILEHIRKEISEIEAKPNDLSEWIDVVILAFDGAWRMGNAPEVIVAALNEKQTKNENRKWPDWRTAEPGRAIEHDRSADA